MDLPFDGAISAFYDKDAPQDVRDRIQGADKKSIIARGYPYKKRLGRTEYEDALAALQIELVKFQHWVRETGQRVAIIFEGRDAAGKGGTIKRFRENMNPRAARAVALSAPNETERGEWYFQRYIKHLPSKGEVVFFDRSWYNRGVVEKVFGFCTDPQRERFFEQVIPFEQMLAEDGISIHKLWLTVGRSEQLRRFLSREADPLKQWKLSSIDVKGLSLWDEYSAAISETLDRSHHDAAPWTVVMTDDKRRGRINAIRSVLSQYDYAHRDDEALGLVDKKMTAGPQLWHDRMHG